MLLTFFRGARKRAGAHRTACRQRTGRGRGQVRRLLERCPVVPTSNLKQLTVDDESVDTRCLMGDLCRLFWCAVVGFFRSRAALQAEVLVLRHQLNVLRRKAPKRLAFSSVDRMLFAGLHQLAPGVLDALKIVKPETVIRWHRAGFRAYWRWKSRPRGGRPPISADICRLIREMSVANPLWGAPRIHGELLKLGIDIGQTTWRNTWRREDGHRRKVGGPFFVIMLTAWHR